MKKLILPLAVILSVLTMFPGAAQKRKGSLSILTYDMRISQEDLDDVREYVWVANFVRNMWPNITALQNVDFVTGTVAKVDAISTFNRFSRMESGFTRNVAENPAAYGVGILTANNPVNSWALPLPGSQYDPVALIHEYSDCIFISVQFPPDEESQVGSVALIDSVATILAPGGKPIFVAGSFYFTPLSEAYEKMSVKFQPLNDILVPTYPAPEPVLCVDYVWAYVASGVDYTVTFREVIQPPREMSLHMPVFVVVGFEAPRKKERER